MKPVPLQGNVLASWGGPLHGSIVLRLRTMADISLPACTDDAAIVTSPADVSVALTSGFRTLIVIGDHSWVEASPGATILAIDESLYYLTSGDIVAYRPGNSTLRVIYRKDSNHNWFLVTEQCDNFCLMCSQPPKARDDSYLIDELHRVVDLLPDDTIKVGFTGGEPLLLGQSFINLVGHLGRKHPGTFVHVLSNGRAFSRHEVASAWAALDHQNLSVGIPLYAAVDYLHDHVVQSKGAFDETIMGILRLKNLRQKVEIRVVLHALTAPRLIETCQWIARNLPFVDHVALMGLENTGFAIANAKDLWIDPLDYRADLAEGAEIIRQSGIRVSIFNLPLCLLEERTRRFAVKSISEWKNAFPDKCDECVRKVDCAGFFSSGRPRMSRGIVALTS